MNGNRQLILNDWKISKKQHALYYGQVVTVPCQGDIRVIRGKPNWMNITDSQWFRTSPIVKWNRNSSDELVSVETKSKHVYIMGTKYKKLAVPLEVQVVTAPQTATVTPQAPVAIVNKEVATVQPLPSNTQAGGIGYDLPLSLGAKSPESLLSVSGPDETMEIIVDPNAVPDVSKKSDVQ